MRAWIAVIAFSVFALVALFYLAPRNDVVAPQAIFFFLLILNTYFSISFFSTKIPVSLRQIAVDTLLVVLYAFLALALGYSLLFPLIATALFLVATGKYVIELGRTTYRETLLRKIYIDVAGASISVLALVVALSGYDVLSAWSFTAIFAAGNIYWLFVDPMYRV